VKEDADGQQVLDYIHDTHHEPLTTQLQQAVLSYPQWELRSVPVSSLHIPDQEYDDEEQEPEADPYNRVQVIDPDHAGEYSANFVDRRPIVVDREGWIIDGNHRAWAASELLNKPTIRAWVPVKQSVTEAFDQPYDIRWSKGDHGDYDAYAELDDGTGLEIAFLDQQHNSWMVDFFRDNSTEITGEGDAYRVFATVLTAIREFIVKQKPDKLNFSAEKQDDPRGSRASLYDRMIQRYISGTGYALTRQNYPDGATYTLTRTQQDVAEDAENFNGIGISMEVEGDEIMVRATAGGRELGHVLFVEDGEYLMPQDLEVEERFQGQGIAAAMYDYVKSKGYKIRRSGQQTDAGAGFWRKNRGEENVWENFADGRNPQDKGDAKRHGINTKASVSSLRKTAKQGGRKGQLAHWLANMKSGRAKAKKK
jgi:GNAT superfamily N-acetyltransferase